MYTKEQVYCLPAGTKFIKIIEGKYPIITTIVLNKAWETKANSFNEAEKKIKEGLKNVFKCHYVDIPNVHKHLKVKEEIFLNPKDYRPPSFRQWAEKMTEK
jgi:hypothetical protein